MYLNRTADMALANITEQEIDEIREMFSLFDTNYDGKITTNELGKVLQRLGYGLTNDELDQLVKEIDFNGSGTIELTEFIHVIQSRKETVQLEDAMRETFLIFDRNNDGFIDKYELKSVMRRLGSNLRDEDILKMIKDADKNQDGRIDYDEFISLWYKYL